MREGWEGTAGDAHVGINIIPRISLIFLIGIPVEYCVRLSRPRECLGLVRLAL